MNKIETKMLEVLKELRDEHGVLAVKAELEAEGSRKNELIRLCEIVFRADMKLFIKIGGCEAVSDLDQCKLLGVSGIMAPMIESPFAMKKFVGAAKKVYGEDLSNVEWIINTETKTCKENLDSILDAGKNFLNTISIGRVDLSSSMGLTRAVINDEEMFEASSYIAKKAKDSGIIVGLGGGISFDAVEFLKRMDGLLDKFETRKIVFKYNNNENQLKAGILKAMEFEILYLQNKCNYYETMANEDKSRIEMMKKRHESAKNDLGI